MWSIANKFLGKGSRWPEIYNLHKNKKVIGKNANIIKDEGKENRILTYLIVKWLKQGRATVYTGKIDKSNNYLSEQCQIANKQDIDLAVQIHFNANNTPYVNRNNI